MPTHSVSLGITPCIRLECKFWLEDDGWNVVCDGLGFAVHAATFEQAKSDMELALGKYLKSLLPENTRQHQKQTAA
jgi:predicted RNase H-like HicB family nuclease